MSYLGSWGIDDFLTFPATTHRVDTGALTDADSVPTYRVYEDETGTAILTGSMAKLDDANTTGFYTEQLTLSAANGFERGKSYTIYITATVNSITGGQHHTFQIGADVNAAYIAGGATSATILNRYWGSAVVTGTADSGTTSTMVDAGRTEADTNYWVGALLVFTSGNIAGQSVRVTDFNAATDTFTFSPETTQAVSTQNYVLIPMQDQQTALAVDVQTIDGTPPDEYLINTAGLATQSSVDTVQTGVTGISTAIGTPAVTVSADIAAVMTTQMTESYAADGVAPTPAQALFALTQYNQDRAIVGTDMKVKKLDGTTDAMTLGLDDATNPTTVSRSA